MAWRSVISCLFVAAAVLPIIQARMLAAAKPNDSFGYPFIQTPEEGPLDPEIEKHYTVRFNACQERAVATQENEACFADEFGRQDRVLNRVWSLTIKRQPPARRERLVAAQRDWVARRDPFCRSKAVEFGGGTIAPLVYMDCRVEQTIRRAIWLQHLR